MTGASEPAHGEAGLRPWQHGCLGGVFLVALLLRAAYLWEQAQNNPLFYAPVMDGLVHHQWAQQIASGVGMGAQPYFRAPLYYSLLGLLYKLTGPSLAAGRIAGAVLGALSCYLIARLGVAFGGFAAGLLAGLIAAAYGPFIYFDGELLTVGLEVFLDVALLLLFASAARRGRLRLFGLAGLCWGLSAITRPNVLALTPAIVAWLWFALPGAHRWRRWLTATVVTGAAAALPVLVVTLRNLLVGGELVLIASQGGVNFYIGNNPHSNGYVAVVPGTRADWWGGYEDTHRIVAQALGREPGENEVSRYWYSQAWAWIRSEPTAWLRLMLLKLRLFWSPLEVPNNQPIRFFAELSPLLRHFWLGFPVVAVLGVAGLALCREPRRIWALLLLFLLVYMATVVAFFCPARYRLPVIPVLIVATAAGLVRLWHTLRARRYGRAAVWSVAAGLTAAFVATNPPHDRATFRAEADAEGHRILAVHYRERQPRSESDVDQAVRHYLAAAKLKPDEPHLRRDLATLLLEAGRQREALPHLEAYLAARPDDLAVRRALAGALYRTGRVAQAVAHLRVVVQRRPDDRRALSALGVALLRLDRPAEAASWLRRALELAPDRRDVRRRLALALRRSGNPQEALAVLREGLRRAPDDVGLLTALAWLQATSVDERLRDPAEAVRLAEQARDAAERPTAEILDTLAAAYAAAGRFEAAVQTARQALELADTPRAGRIAERLRLYEQRQPYHEQ